MTASISAGGADRRAVTAAEVADELQQTAGRATAGANGVGDTAGAAGAIDSRSSRGDSIAPAEAFRHIDTGDASVPRWLHLNPHMVEAGIDDPVHGWVEVRAQGGPGQVLASVSAASPEAHAALHAQLAGMSEYLAAREIGVHTLGVADPGAGGGPASQTGSQGSSTGDSPPRKEENNLPLSPHAREGPARDGAQPVPGQELKSASLHLISVRA